EFDHGTMFYTAPKEGLIDPHHSVQIGIRTEFDKDNGFTVLDAEMVHDDLLAVTLFRRLIKLWVGIERKLQNAFVTTTEHGQRT
ncbi:arginase family protein, partial [Salmonella enterica subsp. enterica serovar Cerro]|nr:arginase family protein [Salmonella enterica subsp. enterica serovar Cerro]